MTRKCIKCNASGFNITRFGHFIRQSDKRLLKRFKCKLCKITFSDATFQLCYRQKKRKLNPKILRYLCSKVSQRRIAILLNISRTTVSRKFLFLAAHIRFKNQKHYQLLGPVHEVQFDDLETFEHSKLKPLSVTLAVERHSRRILGFEVSSMPAKGLLAHKSRKKYGRRLDERAQSRKRLFNRLKVKIHPQAIIQSDQNPHYLEDVKRYFPEANYLTTKGGRGAIVGQGELKKLGYDPLFTLNHTFAMLRDNINRLSRKTWATTKLASRLRDHIELYVYYHNQVLI